MKQYIKLIIVIIFGLGIMGGLFYLLLRQDNSFVTYIKLQVNPSFVIGINKNERVVFYNALNEDANVYNLSMFEGKSLSDATKVFIERLGSSKEEKNVINVTVMTKNDNLIKHISAIISKEIIDFDNSYQINYIEATKEELERYSNEVRYNLPRSKNDDDLKAIGRIVNNKISGYVDDKIKHLKLKKLSKDEEFEVITLKQEEGYFNDFDFSGIKLGEDNLTIGNKSSYKVDFRLVDGSWYYIINLNLELNYKLFSDETTIEVYEYNYELFDDLEKINNLKTSFYVF